MILIKDLINIPESVDKGQFVLKLTDGVIRAEETVADYVVTDELVKCYRDALNYIKDAVESNTSKAAYLHGSFGSGKSHFMAVLHLIRGRNPAVGKLTKLAPAIDAANTWNEGKNFLLVPYHMIGAENMEAGSVVTKPSFKARTSTKNRSPSTRRTAGWSARHPSEVTS